MSIIVIRDSRCRACSSRYEGGDWLPWRTVGYCSEECALAAVGKRPPRRCAADVELLWRRIRIMGRA